MWHWCGVAGRMPHWFGVHAVNAPSVAVVGGGISGLTAAYRLRTLLGDAATITLFDAGERLGGKLRTGVLAGQPFDLGAEAFLARRPEALELIGELGLRDRLEHPAPARATVRAGGRTVALPARTMLGLPPEPSVLEGLLSEDGLAAVAREVELAPVVLGPGDVSLGALLRERFGDELVDRLVDPLLGGVYAGGADGLGLRAVLPELARRLDAGEGSITRAVSALMPPAVSDSPVFGTLRGGLSVLADALLEGARAQVLAGVPVRALERSGAGWAVHCGGGVHAAREVYADAVVIAVPAPSARRLLDGVAPAAVGALAEIELASVAVVALALPPDTELPDASGVLIGAGERHADGAPFTAKAFTFSSRKWAHYGSAGVFVRGSVGRFGDQSALRATDAELTRLVRADLTELTGIAGRPIDAAVTRWGGGLPQYGVGHAALVARIEDAVAEVPGLEIAGATLYGVGIPACIGTADAAAHRLVKRG